MGANDLIFRRSNNPEGLSWSDIRAYAPAIFADSHKDGLSDRYADINSFQAIETLQGMGYAVTNALQKKARKNSPEHVEHFAALSRYDDIRNPDLAERPEILIYNSHDGSSSLKLFVGMFRFVCSNGLIAGDGYSLRVKHSKTGAANFESQLIEAGEQLPRLAERVREFRAINVSERMATEFAEQALSLRWERYQQGSELQGAYWTEHQLITVLNAIRAGDNQANAWTIFNRVQEKLMHGKLEVLSRNNEGREKWRKARPIHAIAEQVRVNRELWNIAENMFLPDHVTATERQPLLIAA